MKLRIVEQWKTEMAKFLGTDETAFEKSESQKTEPKLDTCHCTTCENCQKEWESDPQTLAA